MKYLFFVLPLVTSLCKAVCPALPNPLPSGTNLPAIQHLPDPFSFFDGTRSNSTTDWACRRAELLTLIQQYLYGFYPDHSKETVSAVRSGNTVRTTVTAAGRTSTFSFTLTLPSGISTSPLPVVINNGGVDKNVFLGQGIALASFNPPDVAADSTSKTGAFWSLYAGQNIGVITAWAWGFHRVLDALILVAPEIDLERVGVTGCSRYGKAALAAGIFDERITLTLPMSSGAEGVAPWRFFFEQGGANEKIENIYGVYPYWTTSRLSQFVSDAHRLPFDAHLQAALVAPRALIWDEGTTDYWTNPQGEASVTFPATQAVYNFLGVRDNVGVAIRDSWHCDISGYANIQPFMLKVFFGQATSRNYSDISPYPAYPSAYPWINNVPK
jgi:hypothetical protein